MTSPSFKIIRLPSLAFARVFEQMDLADVFNLTLSSKKFAIQIRWRTKKIQIGLYYFRWHGFLTFWNIKKPDSQPSLAWENVEILDVFSENYNVKSISFKIPYDFHAVEILEHAKELGLKFDKVLCDSSEATTRIFNCCSQASELYFCGYFLVPMSYDGFHNFSMDYFSVVYANWITVDDIFNMRNIKKISLKRLKLVSEEDYIKIIEQWIAGQLDFKEAVFENSPGCGYIIDNRFTDIIPYEDGRPPIVKRANGQLAKVEVESSSIKLSVL